MYPKISVVIPIYNVEKYLPACIDSVLGQSYSNIEIILVDDGSPDRCPEICDKYAKKDKRVKVVHKQNGGLSDARNKGVEVSSGDYLMFLDSDDWIVNDSIKQIASLIHKSPVDVIIGHFLSYPENDVLLNEDVSFDRLIINNECSDEVRKYLFSLPFLFIACRYIVRRNFLLKNNLKFYKGIIHEDEEWTPRLLCTAESFVLYEKPFYCYRKRQENSITAYKNIHNIKSYLMIIDSLENYSKEYPRCSEFFRSRSKAVFSHFISQCHILSKEEITNVSNIIYSNPNILNYIKISNTKLALLIRISGVENGIKLFNRLYVFFRKIRGGR